MKTAEKNISEYQQSLHQEQLNSLGKMAASMAHEINNPVAGVLMNLEYLRLSDVEKAERIEVLTESIDELKRVSRLVKSMLSFSRAKHEVSLTTCSFVCFWQEAKTMIEPILKNSMTSLIIDSEQPDWSLPVLMNTDEMKQIILNLITNALYAMEHLSPRVRRITLDVNRNGNCVVLSIADVGNGIPAELQEKIFNPFFTTKPDGQGTGLGLSLSAKMIEDMGGSLRLDKQYAQGAKFLLSFPIAEKQAT